MTTIAPRAVPVSQVISPAPRSQWEALVAADPTSLTDQSPAWMDVLVDIRRPRGRQSAVRPR